MEMWHSFCTPALKVAFFFLSLSFFSLQPRAHKATLPGFLFHIVYWLLRCTNISLIFLPSSPSFFLTSPCLYYGPFDESVLAGLLHFIPKLPPALGREKWACVGRRFIQQSFPKDLAEREKEGGRKILRRYGQAWRAGDPMWNWFSTLPAIWKGFREMHQEITPVSLTIRDQTGRKRSLGWACNPGLEAR